MDSMRTPWTASPRWYPPGPWALGPGSCVACFHEELKRRGCRRIRWFAGAGRVAASQTWQGSLVRHVACLHALRGAYGGDFHIHVIAWKGEDSSLKESRKHAVVCARHLSAPRRLHARPAAMLAMSRTTSLGVRGLGVGHDLLEVALLALQAAREVLLLVHELGLVLLPLFLGLTEAGDDLVLIAPHEHLANAPQDVRVLVEHRHLLARDLHLLEVDGRHALPRLDLRELALGLLVGLAELGELLGRGLVKLGASAATATPCLRAALAALGRLLGAHQPQLLGEVRVAIVHVQAGLEGLLRLVELALLDLRLREPVVAFDKVRLAPQALARVGLGLRVFALGVVHRRAVAIVHMGARVQRDCLTVQRNGAVKVLGRVRLVALLLLRRSLRHLALPRLALLRRHDGFCIEVGFEIRCGAGVWGCGGRLWNGRLGMRASG
mmetsp:Transcript_20342/g.61779  ORF Transcript_20342/g.61779 Transcript_20342/m.61779 type:complete len:438 (-) Transcript_20342:388-1701(-)